MNAFHAEMGTVHAAVLGLQSRESLGIGNRLTAVVRRRWTARMQGMSDSRC